MEFSFSGFDGVGGERVGILKVKSWAVGCTYEVMMDFTPQHLAGVLNVWKVRGYLWLAHPDSDIGTRLVVNREGSMVICFKTGEFAARLIPSAAKSLRTCLEKEVPEGTVAEEVYHSEEVATDLQLVYDKLPSLGDSTVSVTGEKGTR